MVLMKTMCSDLLKSLYHLFLDCQWSWLDSCFTYVCPQIRYFKSCILHYTINKYHSLYFPHQISLVSSAELSASLLLFRRICKEVQCFVSWNWWPGRWPSVDRWSGSCRSPFPAHTCAQGTKPWSLSRRHHGNTSCPVVASHTHYHLLFLKSCHI